MLAKPEDIKGLKAFKPDYIVDTVIDIDFKYLQARGVKAVFIDLDGTVVSRESFDVDRRLSDYLKKQSLKIFIATNRPSSRDLKDLKRALNATGVIHPAGIFMKPFPRYFKQALSDFKLSPSEVAMIGDRYFQDIFGANLAGLTTVLVYKLGISKGRVDAMISKIEKKHTTNLASRYISTEP